MFKLVLASVVFVAVFAAGMPGARQAVHERPPQVFVLTPNQCIQPPPVEPAPMPKAAITAAYIQKIQPMDKKRALRLGQSIRRWADHFMIDPLLIAAILKQESDFRTGIKSCTPVIRDDKPVETCDHGIAQVNSIWIDTWKLDPDRLVNDDDYNISVAARILAGLKREFAHIDPQWFARYHSSIPFRKAKYLTELAPLLAMR